MVGKRIRNRYRAIKYWFMRANRKLPPCDWWDYKYTLANFIEQGLEGLLYEGNTDWDCDYHKQEKKDLEFILQWAKEFPLYESGIMAQDADDFVHLSTMFSGKEVFIYTKEDWEAFDKKTKKAFTLLAKNIHTLWN